VHAHKRTANLDIDAILDAIGEMTGTELERVREAVEARRGEQTQSNVVERRNHGRGLLQLEYRANPKTGARRGPYWYFHWREGGKQRTVYVGKTEEPEKVLQEKLAELVL
jgi:hypothetical protein